MARPTGWNTDHVPAPCPCQSGSAYPECCGPFHHGDAAAPTAERLMRSRYSAFALDEVEYLLGTWHSTTRPEQLETDSAIRWTGLEIVGRTGGGLLDSAGTVAFQARFSIDGRSDIHRENSRFVREGGRWRYLDGT